MLTTASKQMLDFMIKNRKEIDAWSSGKGPGILESSDALAGFPIIPEGLKGR